MKIKLTGNFENKALGFYILITTINTSSCERYVYSFNSQENVLQLLDNNSIKYKIINE